MFDSIPIRFFVGAMAVAIVAVGTQSALAKNQTPAGKYCLALAEKYNKYVAGSPDSSWLQHTPPGDVAVAQCKEGNPGPAIPVLETEFDHSKVPLPPHPILWVSGSPR
jgi:hypothetical protein